MPADRVGLYCLHILNMTFKVPVNNSGSAMRAFISVLLAAVVVSCSAPAEPVDNLLFICMDTVRYDVFARMGGGAG